MNRFIGIGRITKEIELKTTTTGKNYTNFTIAINRQFNKDETDFINCIAWNKTAEFMDKWIKKGALIGIEGRIQVRNYENQEGKKVYITEIVVEQVTPCEWGERNESKKNSNEAGEFEGFASMEGSDDVPF